MAIYIYTTFAGSTETTGAFPTPATGSASHAIGSGYMPLY